MNLKMAFLLPLLLLLTQSCGKAADLATLNSDETQKEAGQSDFCSSKYMRTIQVPLTVDDDVHRVNYKFMYRPAKPGKTTVIYIPGGPGGTSIDQDFEDALPYLSRSHGAVLTDPRSVGCNANTPDNIFPDETLSTKNLAYDIASIVKELKLKNFVIHGSSYGTVAATMVADRLEQLRLPAPKSLLLEGTLGHAIENEFEVVSDYQKIWDLVRQDLSAPTREMIDRNVFPFGFDEEEMAQMVLFLLFMGDYDEQARFVVRFFEGAYWGDEASKASKASLESLAHATLVENNAQGEEHFHRVVSCREIFPLKNEVSALRDGKFVTVEDEQCGDLKLGSDKFDATNFKIKAPIFYINGGYDPATVVAQMNYHYDAQNLGKKTKMVIPGDGHGPVGTRLKGCMPHMLDQMVEGNAKGVLKIASTCVPDLVGDTKG